MEGGVCCDEISILCHCTASLGENGVELVDEPVANRHFESLTELAAVVASQRTALAADRGRVKRQAGFHWRPQPVAPN